MLDATVEVVIPIYKPEPTADESASLDRTFLVLNKRKISFIAPRGLDVSFYSLRFPQASYRYYPQEYFASVNGYSRLLVSDWFYESGETSNFILIVQTDVYLFRDDLDVWLKSPYDYVGAPWPDGIEVKINVGKFAKIGGKTIRAYVGNGGLSLRRRSRCAELIREHKEIADWFCQTGSNEDLFFAFTGCLSSNFVLPNQIAAAAFSWELSPESFFVLSGGRLPMGVHGFRKHSADFWHTQIKGFDDAATEA